MSETKVVTNKVRFSYVNVFEPRAQEEGGEKYYDICILVPKKDRKMIAKIEEAIEAAIEKGVKGVFGGARPKKLKLPLRDGDEEKESAEFVGMMFFNAKAKRKPGVVDAELNAILDKEEFYSGCYGRASVNFYAFNHEKGGKGVGVGLNHVQKLEDGERLGGDFSSAEDDFGDDLM